MTVVAVEVSPKTRVPEGLGCFHLQRPLDLLAHLPENIDQLRPYDGEMRDVWPRGRYHHFSLLDRPVLVSALASVPRIPGWSWRGSLVSLSLVQPDRLGLLIEVPVGEKASLEGRDCSGDVTSGNGHLLLIEVSPAGELLHELVTEESEGGFGPGGEHPLSVLGDMIVWIAGTVICLYAGKEGFLGHLDQGDLIRERCSDVGVGVAFPNGGATLGSPIDCMVSSLLENICSRSGHR
ncbi:hypothetical protein F2Q69_00022574 [Brassica cretica]|uniref:Uncharacterized protein n=1 Tax=Brassica cretica TaxID=69181 RepID=A0A8S9Q805_BRACR|nr:hypothetical protein F2Q69_00022574 [Brassica cretica]